MGLVSSDDGKPTWNPCATFAELFIAFSHPSSTKRFQLHLEFSFFSLFFHCTSCDFSRYFAAPPLCVVSRDIKYLPGRVSEILLYKVPTGFYMKIMFSLIFHRLFPLHLLISLFPLSSWWTNLLWKNSFQFGLFRPKWDYMFKLYIKTCPPSCIIVTLHKSHFTSAVKFVIEFIRKRKPTPGHRVSRAVCWRCFCYSLCKEGTQMDEIKRFCNRKIFPKKDPESWTRMTPFSCILSSWRKSGCSDSAFVSTSLLLEDLYDVH